MFLVILIFDEVWKAIRGASKRQRNDNIEFSLMFAQLFDILDSKTDLFKKPQNKNNICASENLTLAELRQ